MDDAAREALALGERQVEFLERWARAGEAERLRDFALGLLDRSRTDDRVALVWHVARLLALTPGLDFALALRDLARELDPRELAARAADAQPELVLRRRSLEREPFASFWRGLARRAGTRSPGSRRGAGAASPGAASSRRARRSRSPSTPPPAAARTTTAATAPTVGSRRGARSARSPARPRTSRSLRWWSASSARRGTASSRIPAGSGTTGSTSASPASAAGGTRLAVLAATDTD